MINGESVRLPGMEWMPGSNPHMGMAASALFNKHMLKVLRESNSVMTRFHWQQDESVLNYCDRHGILIQEEIPLWGAAHEDSKKQAELWPVIRQQIEDMITAHCNHPCIFAWGIGNELQADNEDVQMLIRKAVSYVHELDPKRQANYVSNTAWTSPETDGTSIGDCMMVNDYIGTWHKGVTQEGAWQKLMESHLDRAMISSEFGLCEPVFSGGDEERNRIFLQKIAFYRRYPQIVGAISFSLNDYRTHMGEAVDGKERVRVHGSTDLCGNKKPSYYTIQKEYCPLIVRLKENRLMLICRRDIPSYTVHGYYIRKSNRGSRIQIPDLKPGDSWIYLYRGLKESLSIHRPDGTPVFRG